jgi:hypothetical protein
LVDRLNELVLAEGGRFYLAKDAFSRPEHLRAMDNRLAEFEAVRRRWDPHGRFRSAQSTRLLGDAQAGPMVPPADDSPGGRTDSCSRSRQDSGTNRRSFQTPASSATEALRGDAA